MPSIEELIAAIRGYDDELLLIASPMGARSIACRVERRSRRDG